MASVCDRLDQGVCASRGSGNSAFICEVGEHYRTARVVSRLMLMISGLARSGIVFHPVRLPPERARIAIRSRATVSPLIAVANYLQDNALRHRSHVACRRGASAAKGSRDL